MSKTSYIINIQLLIMKVKNIGLRIFLAVLLSSCVTENKQSKNLSGYVNPFIGASTNIEKAGVHIIKLFSSKTKMTYIWSILMLSDLF